MTGSRLKSQIVSFFLTISLIFLATASVRSEDASSDLIRGMAFLSTYKDTDPLLGTAYESLKKTLPVELQEKIDRSEWLDQHKISSKEKLRSKLDNSRMLVFKGSDGKIFAVPRKQIEKIIDSTIQHSVEHPDFVEIYKKSVGKLSPQQREEIKKELGPLAGLLDSATSMKSMIEVANLFGSIARTGLNLDLVKGRLDKLRQQLAKDLKEENEIEGLSVSAEPDTAGLANENNKAAYDETEVASAVNALEAAAEIMKQDRAKFARLCGQVTASDRRLERTLRELQQIGTPTPKGLADTLKTDKVGLTKFQNLAEALSIVDDQSADLGQKACEISKDERPDIVVLDSAVGKIEKLVGQATDLHAQARALHSRLTASLGDHSKLPNAQTFFQSGRKQIENHVSICRSHYEERNKRSTEKTDVWNKQRLVTLGLFEKAQTVLNKAYQFGFKGTGAYQIRINAFQDFFIDRNQPRCNASALSPASQCERFSAVMERKLHDSSREFEGLRSSIVAQRNEQLDAVNKMMARLTRSATRVGFSNAAVRECKISAEVKLDRPSPKLIGEVDALADLSNASCEASNLDLRISRLQHSKFSKVDNIDGLIAQLTRKRDLISEARISFDAAKVNFNAGSPDRATASLRSAKASLSNLSGAPGCSELTERIKKGEIQTRKLAELLSAARSALNTCSTSDVRTALQAIGGLKKPVALLNFKRRLISQQKALALFSQGQAFEREGKLYLAAGAFRKARVASLTGTACATTGQKIGNALARVDGKQTTNRSDAKVSEAAISCDMPALRAFRATANVLSSASRAKVNRAIQACSNEERASKAQQSANDLAGRKAACRRDYGAGYRPGKPDSNGAYYCLPSKKTANRWCNQNNKGSGWRAVKFTGKGGYSCAQGRKQQRAAARQYCRAQARGQGRVYAPTRFKKDGTYTCYSCNRGQVARNGKCYSKNRQAGRKLICPRGYVLRGKSCYPRQRTQRRKKRCGGISDPGTLGRLVIPNC